MKKDEKTLILKADKGDKTVVTDQTEYDLKMLDMLNDQRTYKNLDKDPRKTSETMMNKLLSSRKDRFDEKLSKR